MKQVEVLLQVPLLLPHAFFQKISLKNINDSKKLTFDLRYQLYQELIQHPDIFYAVGVVEAIEIDQINVCKRHSKAMLPGCSALFAHNPDYLLVDGTGFLLAKFHFGHRRRRCFVSIHRSSFNHRLKSQEITS